MLELAMALRCIRRPCRCCACHGPSERIACARIVDGQLESAPDLGPDGEGEAGSVPLQWLRHACVRFALRFVSGYNHSVNGGMALAGVLVILDQGARLGGKLSDEAGVRCCSFLHL